MKIQKIKKMRLIIYTVRNIPKSWSEEDIKKYFSVYGEIGSMIVREPEADKLKKELPEEKKKHILEHKYAFVCFKSLDGPAKKAVAKVPFLKLKDEEYNKKIEEIGKKVNESGVGEDKFDEERKQIRAELDKFAKDTAEKLSNFRVKIYSYVLEKMLKAVKEKKQVKPITFHLNEKNLVHHAPKPGA